MKKKRPYQPKRWLVLDVNYLAHRAYFAFGHLSFGDVLTGPVYGVLRDVLKLQNELDTRHVAFCFDSKYSLRKELAETYKANRVQAWQDKDEEQLRIWLAFRGEIQRMRRRYLPYVGFRNIFCQRGYEADDMIAKVIEATDHRDECVIVSSDHDLYQLLSHRTWMWDPNKKKGYTLKAFHADYGIQPHQWAEVKAIAGCNSDNIKGLDGVGEKGAAQWVAGKLAPGTKKFEHILANVSVINRNRPLVTIPFKDAADVELVEDEVDEARWDKLTERLGMTSLRERRPKLRSERHGKGFNV